MAQPASGGGEAPDAQVQTSPPTDPDAVQAQREQYADEAEQAVQTIEAKIAGMQETLKTAKAEAKRLRSEAKEGRS